MRALLFSSMLLVAGCTATPDLQATQCGAPAGWETIAEASEGNFLLIGEIHGTEEVPTAFGNYVCAATTLGGKTMVGIELDARGQAVMERAMVADDPRPILRDGLSGRWRLQDGKGSIAMLDLLVTLTQLQNVSVIFFDGEADYESLGIVVPAYTSVEEYREWSAGLNRDDRFQARENGMARLLKEEFAAGSFARAVVLTGNWHSPVARYDAYGVTTPLGMLMPDGTVSLNNQFDGGSHWGHTPDGVGARTMTSYRGGVPEGTASPAMGFSDAMAPHHDGYFYVGTITASPPAVTLEE